MRIGIDVDGVLLDTRHFMLKYGSRFFRKKPVNPDAYTVEEIFGVSGLPVLLFGMRWFLPYYCRSYPPYPDAAGVYRRLKRGGHSIYQITARKFAMSDSPLGRYSRRALTNWLHRNGFCCDKLLLCDEKHAAAEKLKYCRQYHVSVMIEDHPVTAKLLAEHGICVLLFDQPYNRGISAENLIRVKNWRGAEQSQRAYLMKKGEKNHE